MGYRISPLMCVSNYRQALCACDRIAVFFTDKCTRMYEKYDKEIQYVTAINRHQAGLCDKGEK